MIANPFSRDIVKEPREIDSTISGLNEKPLKTLIETFETLLEKNFPRQNNFLDHVQFVTSVQAGYGKSHLIGRLFQKLSHQATLVNIRPFHDPETAWKSVLLRIVQELNTTDQLDSKKKGPKQLEAFSHGVLAHLAAIALEKTWTPSQKRDRLINQLQKTSLEQFAKSEKNVNWMKNNYEMLVENFQDIIPNSYASVSSWIRVLLKLAYSRSGYDIRQACLDWLKGGPITVSVQLPPLVQK